MNTKWHNGKRLPDGTLDVADENWIEGDPIPTGYTFVPLMNDRGAGWVDTSSPRGWGKEVTGGKGFARRYDKFDRPVYANAAECHEAIRRAQDHGEKVVAIRDRDYPV